jgi:hypothetical protein
MLNTLALMHNLNGNELTSHKLSHRKNSKKTSIYDSQQALKIKAKNGHYNLNAA